MLCLLHYLPSLWKFFSAKPKGWGSSLTTGLVAKIWCSHQIDWVFHLWLRPQALLQAKVTWDHILHPLWAAWIHLCVPHAHILGMNEEAQRGYRESSLEAASNADTVWTSGIRGKQPSQKQEIIVESVSWGKLLCESFSQYTFKSIKSYLNLYQHC